MTRAVRTRPCSLLCSYAEIQKLSLNDLCYMTQLCQVFGLCKPSSPICVQNQVLKYNCEIDF